MLVSVMVVLVSVELVLVSVVVILVTVLLITVSEVVVVVSMSVHVVFVVEVSVSEHVVLVFEMVMFVVLSYIFVDGYELRFFLISCLCLQFRKLDLPTLRFHFPRNDVNLYNIDWYLDSHLIWSSLCEAL